MSTQSQRCFHVHELTNVAQRLSRAVTAVSQLQGKLRNQAGPRDFDAVRTALESLPGTTGAFALACQRLDNAVQYHRRGEEGAANYELTLLRHSLAREAKDERR
jgi:hypothetical protein